MTAGEGAVQRPRLHGVFVSRREREAQRGGAHSCRAPRCTAAASCFFWLLQTLAFARARQSPTPYKHIAHTTETTTAPTTTLVQPAPETQQQQQAASVPPTPQQQQQQQQPFSSGGDASAPARVTATLYPPPPSADGADAGALRLAIGACCLPHPEKAHYGGEDAFFISPAGGGALGVADGVGGWAESGVNPAQYSRTLMRVACAFLEGAEGDELARAAAEGAGARSADSSVAASLESYSSSLDSGDEGGGGGGGADAFVAAAALAGRAGAADPRAALDAAHRRTRCAGSATAVVVQLDAARRRLVAANLGDSGFVVARGGNVIARSRPLQHFFDCPLQLGAFPEFVDSTDTAAQAELFEVALQPGDVVVAGSDGLWDNLYDADLLARLPTDAAGAQAAADAIAAAARRNAADPEFHSPYAKEALQQGYDLPWHEKLLGAKVKDGKFTLASLTGGKQDDITVLVAVAVGAGGSA